MNIRDRFARKAKQESGFTLVELMVAMVISGIIVAAVYSAYTVQQSIYLAQEQVAEMQQNVRAGLDIMKRELRMAGYDPTEGAGAGITTANAGQISFTRDITEDGDTADPGELIEFGFKVADDSARDGVPDADSDGDGVPDAVSLGRQTGGAGGYQPVAESIQAIEFRYLDSFGAVLAMPVTLADIRAIQISILARVRVGQHDRKFTNTKTYTSASGVNWGPFNDKFRRRLLVTTVNLRNMGL